MTTDLECCISVVSRGLDEKAQQLAALPQLIQADFQQFSHGEVNLTVSSSPIAQPSDADTPVSALELHNYLLQVNQNPPSGPLKRICVLLAHSYAGLPGAFGMMFDRGFTTVDDPNRAPIYLDRPRQGCAVFLGQIAMSRTAGAFVSEVEFTTIHELGHVFNLQHDETSLNFMRVSDAQTNYGPGAFHFTPYQQSRLESCGTDENVTPGGSVFGSDGAYNLPGRRLPKPSKVLDLKIAVARGHFFRFEPTQLEIEISLKPGRTKPVDITAAVDPSHGAFRLFVDDPSGERRLYRPPFTVCGSSSTIRIAANRPYRRDFAVFGQAGGYTFRRCGYHVLRAELDLGSETLHSNALEVQVREEVGLDAHAREMRSVLMDPQVGRLLFHREVGGDLVGFRKLSRYVDGHPEVAPAPEIQYALARALIKAGPAGGFRDAASHATRWLQRVVSAPSAGRHVQERADALLQYAQPRPTRARSRAEGRGKAGVDESLTSKRSR